MIFTICEFRVSGEVVRKDIFDEYTLGTPNELISDVRDKIQPTHSDAKIPT
jgi:hypothetical protein